MHFRYFLIIMTLFSQPALSNVEFLHWWTSLGEHAALQQLKKQLTENHLTLEESSVYGGGGDSALMVLQARALAGNTPHFAQIEGPSIKAWDAIGILYNLDPIAINQKWNDVLNPLAQQVNKTKNGYVALPITLHKMNWLWTNRQLLSELHLEPPKTWSEMISAMETAKNNDILPLAVGKRPWQIAQLFEHVTIAIGGARFYQKALVELDKSAFNSDKMKLIVSKFRELSKIVSDDLSPDSWDKMTEKLANNQALFQLGGDWILGELLALGVKVPEQINCATTPQTEDIYVYNIDSFIFLKRHDFNRPSALKIAEVLAEKGFQRTFNQVKGSIPVRNDISLKEFNICQQKSARYLNNALQKQTAVPSMTDSMAVNPIEQNAINNELFSFFTNQQITAESLIRRMIAISESS